MWILVIMFLHTQAKVEEYPAPEVCYKELVRISQEMKEAYPEDENFTFECRYVPQII